MIRLAFSFAIVAGLALASAQGAAAQQVVRLGAYHFPPYAVNTADGMGGLVADLAAVLNERQDDYVFVVVPTTSAGRYADFENGLYDAIAFESLAWGWDGLPVTASEEFMSGAEVYVARAEPGRGQAFFADIPTKKIGTVYGYHYGFADFNADPAWLHRNFMIEQAINPGTILYYVIDGRVDLSVVSDLYLDVFVKQHPEFEDAFLVSDEVDQLYHLTVLVADDGPLPVADINALLAGLEADGTLLRMVAPYVE